MIGKKQILLAFIIPLILAVLLVLIEDFVLIDPDLVDTNGIAYSPYEEYTSPLYLRIAVLTIGGLIVLSLILPFLLLLRTYQNRKNKSKLTSIIE